METNQSEPNLAAVGDMPLAPPTVAGPVIRPSPPAGTSIVDAVAIAAVVLGALGILRSAWGLLPLMLFAGTGFPGAQGVSVGWLIFVMPAAGAGLACLLVMAGIGLLNRRAWGARVGFWWAGLRIALSVAGLAWWVAVPFWTTSGAVGAAPMIAMSLVSVAWGCGLPVAYIVCMTRPSARTRLRAWRVQGSPAA